MINDLIDDAAICASGPTRSTTTGPPTSPSAPIPTACSRWPSSPTPIPSTAAAEVRRCAKMGLRGRRSRLQAHEPAALPSRLVSRCGRRRPSASSRSPSTRPASRRVRAPDTPEMEKEYCTQWRLVRSALFQLDTMEVLVSLLASGACEKYPDFNFVLGESGVTWLPYVFDRLDTEYHDRARSLGFKLKPSDYFRRQGYVTYQQDKYLEPIMPLIGEDNIIWGADYPHPDCIWPNSRGTLAEEPRRMSPSACRRRSPATTWCGSTTSPVEGPHDRRRARHSVASSDKVSPEEWAVRVDLAARYRLVVRYGWEDLVFTHISAARAGHRGPVPDQPLRRSSSTRSRASSLVKIDLDGKQGRRLAVPGERGRASSSTAPSTPRVTTPSACCTRTPRPASRSRPSGPGSCRSRSTRCSCSTSLSYHDFEGAGARRRREAAPGRGPRRHALADPAQPRAAHGGREVADAFVRMYYLESSCAIQVRGAVRRRRADLGPEGSLDAGYARPTPSGAPRRSGQARVAGAAAPPRPSRSLVQELTSCASPARSR